MRRYTFTYLSLGAGVQSTALLILANQGKTEPVDVAIFADTQCEPHWVYENLERLKAYSKIPIDVVTIGNLGAAALNPKKKFGAMPLFAHGSNGHEISLRRQCTREYKIRPIERRVKTLMGFSKGDHMTGIVTVKALIGISLDEAIRVKSSQTPWIKNSFPLIRFRLRRSDCKNIIEEVGLPIPMKSACYFCPYHNDAFWEDLRSNYPQEFQRAVDFDFKVRNIHGDGPAVFLHRSLQPLNVVTFQPRRKPEVQERVDFAEECEGMCGL